MKIKIIMLVSILVLGLMYWWSIRDQRAKLIFCDVGQGDGILISKKTKQFLVDTGPDNKKILGCLERHVPFWDKTIEVLILSHGDLDHAGGLKDLLKNYKINNVFSNEDVDGLIEQNIYSKKLSQDDILKFGLINFEVVNPLNFENILDDKNTNSIAGILSYKDFKIFLSGDISQEVEQRLVWQKIIEEPVDILKLSHHGSETATSDELLEILKPKVAVISVGKENKFGHPNLEVIDRLKEKGVKIKRTDEEGELVYELEN